MLVRQFNFAQFSSIAVSHLFGFLGTPHWSPLPSSNVLFFLPFLSASCSLSFLVSLSIVVFSFLLIAVLSFVISPWWIWWFEFFSYCCRCVTIVSYAGTVRAAWYDSFRAPVVQYRLYHAGTTIWHCPVCIHCHVTFDWFANSTLITTLFLKLCCLPSFPSPLLALPLSHSLVFLVCLIIFVLLFLLIVVLLFVIAPWWISQVHLLYLRSSSCNCPFLISGVQKVGPEWWCFIITFMIDWGIW